MGGWKTNEERERMNSEWIYQPNRISGQFRVCTASSSLEMIVLTLHPPTLPWARCHEWQYAPAVVVPRRRRSVHYPPVLVEPPRVVVPREAVVVEACMDRGFEIPTGGDWVLTTVPLPIMLLLLLLWWWLDRTMVFPPPKEQQQQ